MALHQYIRIYIIMNCDETVGTDYGGSRQADDDSKLHLNNHNSNKCL